MSRPWVVLKYGGTSVATAEKWGAIAARAAELLPDHRVWIVASAVSQVSNLLERAVEEAIHGAAAVSFGEIVDKHEALGADLGLGDRTMTTTRALLAELRSLLEGIRLTREASPRLRARVLSFGELASTALGVAALEAKGLGVCRVDARRLLRSESDPRQALETRFLAADVPVRVDVESAEAAAGGAEVVLTQGFIASTVMGETCLLGRGGSDTSAALFAALLDAASLEIWTDVHGMFTTDPRKLPSARLIRRIRYREAQELAAMGAKVLHPRCLEPVRQRGIPLHIRNTADPSVSGTTIDAAPGDDPRVLAVVMRSGVSLVNVETLSMWGVPGFLSQAFKPFADHGVSVDLVATSQSAVTVTLDHIPGGPRGETFARLIDDLGKLGGVTVAHGCAVVSIVGRRIRTVLHELGPSFKAFEEHKVHLVSASSEDMNLSFVVDETDALRLVRSLHGKLFGAGSTPEWLGASWEALTAPGRAATPQPRWWRTRREELLVLAEQGPVYVYDLATVRRQAQALTSSLTSVDRLFYAMKANHQPDILRTIAAEGIGMEAVSAAEIALARQLLGDVRILFTPNFCPIDEYATAFEAGAAVTIDGPDVLLQAPELFRGRAVALRVDPGGGRGHHDKVKTAGARTKFGHPLARLDEVIEVASSLDVRIEGLHAHVGSGILTPEPWARTGGLLATARRSLPDLRWVDVGGGLGVVERPGQTPLDLSAVQTGLSSLATALGDVELWMEPGRYLVSEAGVLLVPVTQVRTKGDITFVGGATGMNSLIRPALYGAWHGIHNLSRLDEPAAGTVQVVGPICETGDILGRDRLLPETFPGDVLLVENGGAYGAVMASSYNLRPPASERCL